MTYINAGRPQLNYPECYANIFDLELTAWFVTGDEHQQLSSHR